MSAVTLPAPGRLVQIEAGDHSVVYREVPGWPGYAVGDDGSVWSRRHRKSWHRMKIKSGPYGHQSVELQVDSKHYFAWVHRLVLETFVGPCPPGMEACHAPDRNPANNRLHNLRWDTHEGNGLDLRRDGTAVRGSRHHLSKLNEAVVLDIVRRLKSGESKRTIASSVGITGCTVNDISRGRSWGWLTGIVPKS